MTANEEKTVRRAALTPRARRAVEIIEEADSVVVELERSGANFGRSSPAAQLQVALRALAMADRRARPARPRHQ